MTQSKSENTNSENDQIPSTATSGGKQTPIDERARRTGQGAMQADVRPGAEADSPGVDSPMKEGAPNQGTESR